MVYTVTHQIQMHILIKVSLSLLHILVNAELVQKRVLQEVSSGGGLMVFSVVCPLIVTEAGKDSAD